MVAQEVATLRSHFDSVTLVFASAGEDRRQEGDGTDTLNLNAWANRVATCRPGRHCLRSTSSAERKVRLGPRHRDWFVSDHGACRSDWGKKEAQCHHLPHRVIYVTVLIHSFSKT